MVEMMPVTIIMTVRDQLDMELNKVIRKTDVN